MNTFFAKLAATLALALSSISPATAEIASINGLRMFYEEHGQGEPLVLLHGAYMSNNSNWTAMIPTLAGTHRVVAVELQGHGRTSDRDTPITYDRMADDVSALLDHLKIEKASVMGYSMGGTVAMRLAIDHPEKVSRLISAAAGMSYTEEVLGKDFFAMIRSITPEQFKGTVFETDYAKLAPDPTQFPVLVGKLKALDLETYDWSADFAKIGVPALYIFGDADIVSTGHAAEMHKLAGGITNGDMNGLPKVQLLVLPGTSHGGVFFNPANVEILKAVVPSFLTQELPAKPKMSM